MKTLVIVALLAAAALLTAGCGDGSVTQISEHEGCKVYRVSNPTFLGSPIYYTVCGRDQRVKTEYRHSCGKNCTRAEAVETVWR
jgi:hypothetical protein